MAHLYRLIVALLLFITASAQASFPVSGQTQFRYTNAQSVDSWHPSLGAVCALIGPGNYPAIMELDQRPSGAAYCVRYTPPWNGSGAWISIGTRTVQGCPANATQSGTTCTCSSGYREAANACVAITPDDLLADYCAGLPKNKQDIQISRSSNAGGIPSVPWVCDVPMQTVVGNWDPGTPMFPGTTKGCLKSAEFFAGFEGTDGKWYYSGKATSMGGTCNPSAVPVENPADPAPVVPTPVENSNNDNKGCASGYKGVVNGVETCVQPDKTSGVGETKWTENSDGTKEKTTATTTCDGTKCETKTTTTKVDASGNTTGTSTSTSTSTQGEFCGKNPNAPACNGGKANAGSGNGEGEEDGDKSSFGGSCSAGFTCEGDALQCAMAKEQHKRACEFFVDETDESRLYAAEVAKGRNRDVTADLPGNRTVDVSSQLDSSNFLGSASCISDLSVTVWGHDVSLPMSNICTVLGYLGWVLVTVASLVGFRIVSGAFKEA